MISTAVCVLLLTLEEVLLCVHVRIVCDYVERGPAGHHLEHQHAQSPPVHAEPCGGGRWRSRLENLQLTCGHDGETSSSLTVVLASQDLWGDVVRCAAEGTGGVTWSDSLLGREEGGRRLEENTKASVSVVEMKEVAWKMCEKMKKKTGAPVNTRPLHY